MAATTNSGRNGHGGGGKGLDGPATILVIEDNPVNMELVSDVLESAGHRVMGAGSAEEGITLARRHLPDVVLMDIALPGMDGLSATAVLKRDPVTRDIPVIALTAHAMKGDAERALALGCAGYITKPIETRSFLDTVRRCVAGEATPSGAASDALPAASPAPPTEPVVPAQPAARRVFVPAAAPTAAAIPADAAAAKTAPLLLVADPDAAQRAALEAMLRGAGFAAESVPDAVTALERMAAPGAVDLVVVAAPLLADVAAAAWLVKPSHTPGGGDSKGDGADGSAAADIPLLAVLADGGPGARRRAGEAGATDQIVQPVDAAELTVRVAALLKVGRAQAAAREAREEARLARIGRTEAAQTAKRAQTDTVYRLAHAAECREPAALGELHLHCVAQYSAILAQAAGLPPAEVETVMHASALHDVGMLFVPERLARKKRPTRADRQRVQEHTTRGANFLAEADGDLVRAGETIARSHHERWNGGGYPHGLVGEEIPLYGRIVAVADAFDTFARLRPEADLQQALDALAESHGTVLDPDLVDLFFGKRVRVGMVFERARRQRMEAVAAATIDAEREAARAEADTERTAARRAAGESAASAAATVTFSTGRPSPAPSEAGESVGRFATATNPAG